MMLYPQYSDVIITDADDPMCYMFVVIHGN